ncbi:unnamed protein product [Camellia sinensis]
MRWEKLQMGPVYGPGKMWGHTCTAIRGGKFLYVFGGYGKDNSQTNQVHVFDTATRTWSDPVMKGTPPVPRDSHSCTAIGDNLFVFGGTDGQNPLNDLHILDTSTHTWISPSVRGEGPEAREGHSAAVVGRRLFIFGGCGKSSNNSDEEFFDDLYILNTETFVWKRAATLGCPPAKRDSHTCSSWKNKIIIIGGEDSYDYYLSDVHILDADTLVWSKLFTSGQLLPPRAGHTTVALGKNLFVFGGFTDESNLYDDLYMLDIGTGINHRVDIILGLFAENHETCRTICSRHLCTGVWTQVMATGNGPCARFSMAGDSLDPQKSGILVFLGGCSKNLEALDDMFYLHTGLTTENERDERRLEKLSLRKQLKLKCQEQNMLTPPAYDKALVRIETNADLYQPIPMPSIEPMISAAFLISSGSNAGKPHVYSREYQPFPRKRTFQAKVTKCFPVALTKLMIILKVMLYSQIRRKGAVEIDGVKLKDNQKSKSEIDSAHGKNTEAAAATANTKSPAPSDASQPHEVAKRLEKLQRDFLWGNGREVFHYHLVAWEQLCSPKKRGGLGERLWRKVDAGNLKVPVVADINVEDNETGIAPNSSMEVHKENPSSADKDYHFVPNSKMKYFGFLGCQMQFDAFSSHVLIGETYSYNCDNLDLSVKWNREGRALTAEEDGSLIKNDPVCNHFEALGDNIILRRL